MVPPAGLLEPQDGETKDVVLWAREAAEEAAHREYEKRQLGLIFTLGFPPVVISVGLDSNGVPAFSVTLNDGTNTTPTAVATAANTATAAPVATTQAPAATTAAVPGTGVGTSSAINTGLLTSALVTSAATLQTTTEVIFAGGSSATSVITMTSSSTAAASSKSASPPVIAGAVVGSIGGVALLLLLLVMFLRWRRHRNDNRHSMGGDSVKALHTGPAPIMPHNSARTTMYPPPPPEPMERTGSLSFLPAGAAGWLNRLSGNPLRAESPVDPRVRETQGHDNRQTFMSFNNVPGSPRSPKRFPGSLRSRPGTTFFPESPRSRPRTTLFPGSLRSRPGTPKMPTAMPNKPEDIPELPKTDMTDALLDAPSAAFTEKNRVSTLSEMSARSNENNKINNNPEWFNSPQEPPVAVTAAARSMSPHQPTQHNQPMSPIQSVPPAQPKSPGHVLPPAQPMSPFHLAPPNSNGFFPDQNHRPYSFEDYNNNNSNPYGWRPPQPVAPEPRPTPLRTVSFVPPYPDSTRNSVNPAYNERAPDNVSKQDFTTAASERYKSTPAPNERGPGSVATQDFATAASERYKPTPARTGEWREAPPPISIPPTSYNPQAPHSAPYGDSARWGGRSPWGRESRWAQADSAQWGQPDNSRWGGRSPWDTPLSPKPPDTGPPADQRGWYQPYSPQTAFAFAKQVETQSWPVPPMVDWERLSRMRPKGI